MNFSLRCFLGFHRWGKSWRRYLLNEAKDGHDRMEQRWCCERWPCEAKRTTLEPVT